MAADAATADAPRPLTDQQRRALAARGVSVALSAGAGCGKTFALTARFLRQLAPAGEADGATTRLSQVVAITFTDRAAREMRDRVRDACRRRLAACPEAEVAHWLNLVRELDTARISTIHSFCGALLRRHAVEAGLDPRFLVLEQSQADTLRTESLDQELNGLLAEGHVETIALAADFGLDGLREMVAALLRKRSEIDWPQWRHTTPEQLVARWHDFWRNTALPQTLRGLAESPFGRRLYELARQRPCAHAKMQPRFDALAELLPRLADSADPAGDLERLREAAMVQGATAKNWPDADVYGAFKEAAEQFRKRADGMKPLLSFDAAAALPAAQASLGLLAVAERVNAAYQQRKDEAAALDFDDLLIRARRLLTDPAHDGLRRRLQQQIRLLLVDEFQDTDPLQVELVRALCGPELFAGRLFFVGDLKQSIYRFRGAQPQVFRQFRGEVPAAGQLPLSLNFRSQPAILRFVNALFAEALGPDYEPLQAHRPQLGPTPAVEFLWACPAPADTDAAIADDRPPPDEDRPAADDDMGKTERLRRLEAEWIARRIRAMLDGGEPIVCELRDDQPQLRPARQGDVAILFRALTDVEYYEDALRRYGIEYYLVGGKAFYAQQEVYDLVHLLRAVDNPADDLSLLGALRSPMFSLHDETIFWLAQHPGGLGAGLMAAGLPTEIAAEQRPQAARAAATLRELRAMKDRVPIARLLDAAFARTGYDALLQAEFLGLRKLANLRKLVEQARGFDQSGVLGLADFITQLSEFVARQPDEAPAATQAESADVVRLMSIHQSKGLEFPVVFVADLARPHRGQRARAAFSRELGPMVKGDAPGGFELYAAAEDAEDAAEIVRLLYVAATRAADYLVLSAGVEAPGEGSSPWMQLLAGRFDLVSGEFRGAPEQARGSEPLVQVIAAPPEAAGGRLRGPAPPDLKRLVAAVREAAGPEGPGGKQALALPPLVGPLAPDAAARRQYSFSRLTGRLARSGAPPPGEAAPLATADDLPEPTVDPRGLGTLVHAVLAELDFRQPTGVRELVHRLAPHHLPAADALDEPIELIERFVATPRAAAVAAAQQCHRELEFLLAWPPTPADGHAAAGGRYIQGFLDCLYQDADGAWRLLDYKTNRVSAAEVAAAAADYEMQMLLYALAVEQTLHEPPAELALCFLRPGVEHRFAWDAAARRRVVALVEAALGSSPMG